MIASRAVTQRTPPNDPGMGHGSLAYGDYGTSRATAAEPVVSALSLQQAQVTTAAFALVRQRFESSTAAYSTSYTWCPDSPTSIRPVWGARGGATFHDRPRWLKWNSTLLAEGLGRQSATRPGAAGRFPATPPRSVIPIALFSGQRVPVAWYHRRAKLLSESYRTRMTESNAGKPHSNIEPLTFSAACKDGSEREATHQCLDDQVLLQFQLGKLDLQQISLVAASIGDCERCTARLAALDPAEDSLVAQLKSCTLHAPAVAHAHESTVVTPLGASAASLANESVQLQNNVATHLPRLLGQYRIELLIGKGGMGTVWQATHERLKRKVAIKLLPPERLVDPELVARFFREIEVCGRLVHPHLVHAYDAGEVDGQPFLVMELLEGVDLADLVRRSGPLSVPEACELARQAAAGLEFAHANQSVHRDVKPSNLFLTSSGTLKVLDLGLARWVDAAIPGQGAMTARHQVLGTLAYMAPEQFRDSHSVTAAADIYALGCTLYFLLVGKPPFGGRAVDDPIPMAVAHATATPPKLSQQASHVPADLAALVDRMLAKDPRQRPESMRQVEEQLAPHCTHAQPMLQQRLSSLDVAKDDEPAATEPLIVAPRLPRRKWIVFMAITCGIMLPVLGYFILSAEKTGHSAAQRAIDAFELSPSLRTAIENSLRLHPDQTSWTGKAGSTLFALQAQPLPMGPRRQQGLPVWIKKGQVDALAELFQAKSLIDQFAGARLDDTTMLQAAMASLAQSQQVSGVAKQVSEHSRQEGDYLITLVYGPEQAIVTELQRPATLTVVQAAYRDAIHRQSRELMKRKQWNEALTLWRHLHDRQLVTPELYLDAARCFHALGQDSDALRLIDESLDNYAEQSQWTLLEQAGDLASQLPVDGAQMVAERAFTMALKRFQIRNF